MQTKRSLLLIEYQGSSAAVKKDLLDVCQLNWKNHSDDLIIVEKNGIHSSIDIFKKVNNFQGIVLPNKYSGLEYFSLEFPNNLGFETFVMQKAYANVPITYIPIASCSSDVQIFKDLVKRYPKQFKCPKINNGESIVQLIN